MDEWIDQSICPRDAEAAVGVAHIYTHTHIHNSPVRSNPDTFIITRVLASFGLVPGLAACRTLIVCDGFQVAGPGTAPK